MSGTNRLRTTGTANLLVAVHRVGAPRFLTQSIVFGYGYRDHGDTALTEVEPFGQQDNGPLGPTLAAMRSAEEQIFTWR